MSRQDVDIKIFHTDHFLSCPFGTIQNGIRAFDFIRANDGTYFAVADWNATGSTSLMHLFMSEGSGVPLDTAGGPNSLVWREFCPGTLTVGYDGGPITGSPISNWTTAVEPLQFLCTTSPPPFGTSAALLFPALATDGLDRLSLMYIVSPDRFHFHPRYHGNIAPRTATATMQTIELLSSSFSASGAALLDFNTMTAWGAQTPNPCTSAADFFPVWVFADGTSSTLKFTHVNL